MKKAVLITTLGIFVSIAAMYPLRSAKAALPRSKQAAARTPKRVLLVTVTLGFHHAAIPDLEQVIRQMAKKTGEFTVVSTTDSPYYPRAAYESEVKQRNARMPVSRNDKPPIDGFFGGPTGTAPQYAGVAEMNAQLQGPLRALRSATQSLNSAIYSGTASAAEINAKVDAKTAAELALAEARFRAVQTIQSIPALRLDDQQLQAIANTAASGLGGGIGGFGGLRGAGAPVQFSPSQQAAVAAMNDSVQQEASAQTAADAALTRAPYSPTTTPAELQAKADSLRAAELALANAKVAAFEKIQSSPNRLTPEQAQSAERLAALQNLRKFFGTGESGNTNEAVAKVLQQYMNPEALKNYDAVIFCSTTGELPIPDKAGFFKWIADGHGFVGIHSATDTLHHTPEYIKMIGGEFAGHGNFHPAAPVINMDPSSPINAGWGESRTIYEEWYLFRNFHLNDVHILLALPYNPYTKQQPGIYPVSWIKMYGKGRVYYTSMGHRDDVILPNATIGDQEYKTRFNQAPVALAFQRQLLQGIRWALGLINADATPQKW